MFPEKRNPLKLKHNKAFKRDSCRVAFLVCGDFCGESGVRKLGLCGIHPLTRRYVLWEKMDMDIPDRFKNVRYVSSRIPGCKDDSDLTLGANCQVFAYNLLRDFGLNPPNYRSSELWNDSELSEVTEFKPLSCCTTTLLIHTEHTLECTPVMDSSTICLCPMAYPSLSAI